MFKLVYTENIKEESVFLFDTIEEAEEYWTQERRPCAIVSENGILVKLFIDGEWITFH